MIHLCSSLIFALMLFIFSQAQAEEQSFAAAQDANQHHDQRQSHIASLMEWFEEQQAYLKYLENLKGAVEKELSIISLMSACQQQGAECTGRGIVLSAETKPASSPPTAPSADEEDSQQRAAQSQPKLSEPQSLPIVLAIYQDSALVEYQGRHLRVRAGDRLAGFHVRAIGLDQFELESADGIIRLPVYWPLSLMSVNNPERRLR